MRSFFIWLVVVVALLVGGVVGVNFYDPALSDDANRLAAIPPNPYPAERNIYVALKGLDAPAGADVVKTGLARVADDDRLAELYWENSDKAQAAFKERAVPALTFNGEVDFCTALWDSCWYAASAHAQEIVALRESNAELYARYLALPGLPGYYDLSAPTLLMTSPRLPRGLRELFLADVALRIRQPSHVLEREEALQTLHADMSLWRTVLRGDGDLVWKMVATSNLHADYLLLGDMITDRGIDLSAYAPQIETMLDLMTPQDWRIGSFVGREYRSVVRVLQSLKDSPDKMEFPAEDRDPAREWVQRNSRRAMLHFLKINASSNRVAASYTRLRNSIDADQAQYAAEKRLCDEWLADYARMGPAMLYNPFGHILTSIAMPDFANHGLRARDVAAFQQLVRVSYEIRRQGLDNDAVAAFIKDHPELAAHPISGQAFEWDARMRELRLLTVGSTTRSERRFHLKIPAAAPV